MTDKLYGRFHQEELTVRDELAVDRTVLANERTLLAYVRTALGFLVLGLTFLHFLKQLFYHAVGYTFMAVGVFVLLVGVIRFFWMRSQLNALRLAAAEHAGDEPPPAAHKEAEAD